jgi:Protein of unknown function (DUF2695)
MAMDRKEKKRLVDEWARENRAAARAALPLPDDQFQALFDYVDEHLESQGCDHSRRFTEQWLSMKGVVAEPVLRWLEENGGYCDCEAIANAEEAWESTKERPRRTDA